MNKKGFASTVNVILIILLTCLLGALGFFGYKAFFSKEKILVPDFTNKNEQEVVTWCNSLELENNPCTIETDYSNDVAKGNVIYQSIAADQELGDSIRFIISLGKKVSIEIPQIQKDTTKEDIEKWVAENGLTNVNYVQVESDDIEKGMIIKIEPILIEALDAQVNVYISNGKKIDTTVIVVESNAYTNLTVEEFEKKVKALGLTPTHAEEKDGYNAKITKGNIVWHGSGEYEKDEKIRYGICKGDPDSVITVVKGTYVGLSVDDFKDTVSKLGKTGLVANHNEDFDSYSSTIAKGLVVAHGSGDYENNEKISYGVSLGEDKNKIIVSYGTWINETVDKLTKDVAKLGSKGLSPNHNKDKDEYSKTVTKGNIIWHGSGEYEDGETINYGLSLGKQGSDSDEIVVTQGTYIGKTLDEFKKAVEELGLKPYHREEWDVADASKGKNIICRNGYGTYVKGENISYGLYTGAKDDVITINKKQFVGKTLDEFKDAVTKLGLVPKHSESYEDEYSTTIAKGLIDWHGSGDYTKGEVIHYTVSLGIEQKITVASGYVGKTVSEFESYIKGLGLTPKADGSDYSDSIGSGLVLSYATGDYSKGSTVKYKTSQGTNPNVTVPSGLEGKSVSEFTSAIPSSLNVANDSSLDSYSNTIAAGKVCAYTSGTYTKGDTVYYGLSKGKAPATINSVDFYNTQYGTNCRSYDEMKGVMESLLSGFSNVRYESVKSFNYDPGMLEKIEVNGSDTYEPGQISSDTPIVVYIVSAKQ